MASFLDKMKINTATDSRVKLDLGSQHISTANFMQYNVAWSKELVPGEKISVNMETFVRMNPLPVPTFGRGNINTRAFFVPFRTIFPAWTDFITDTRHNFNIAGVALGQSQLVTSVPTVANNTLVSLFTTTTGDYALSFKVDTAALADFVLPGDGNRYKFNTKGRQFYKQLLSLGYNINWTTTDNTKYSALPLIALAKVYIDWYWPSQYASDTRYANVDAICNYNSITSASSQYNFALTTAHLQNILSVISEGVCYDSDYFVSAWDNPVNPTDGAYSNVTLTDITTYNGGQGANYMPTISADSTSYTGGTPTISANGTGDSKLISQYAVTALKSLTDYMKRHQLVGARALDRYLARFGYNLPAEKLNRSIYLGSKHQPLQFGDIMSTASTDTAPLGGFAGKGISYGDGSFEFETEEYGIMIIISSIIPRTGYYQGVDRNVLHIGKLDYYTPEFDNLGTQPITQSELFLPMDASSVTNPQNLQTGIFGFTPRYAEYKTGKDRLTGDFRVNSADTTLDAWHMLREVEYEGSETPAHNVGFVRGKDALQYSRIFYNADTEVDQMYVIYNFDVTSSSPMKSMFDTYEFEDKGKAVIEDVNGVKMN